MINDPIIEKWADEFCNRFCIDRNFVKDEVLEIEYNFFMGKGERKDVGTDRV